MDMQLLKDKINRASSIDIRKVNIDDLNDFDDIKIDDSKTSRERIIDFLMEVNNPYFFKCNGYIVKTSFSDYGILAEDCVLDAFKSIYK